MYTYAQALNDEHVKARRMVVDVEHPLIGPMRMLGLPVKSADELTSIRNPAPWLGQHTVDALRELGLDANTIDGLFRDRVVYDRRRGA